MASVLSRILSCVIAYWTSRQYGSPLVIPFKNTKIEYTSKIKDGDPIKQIAEQSILEKTIDELPMELLVSICSIDGHLFGKSTRQTI